MAVQADCLVIVVSADEEFAADTRVLIQGLEGFAAEHVVDGTACLSRLASAAGPSTVVLIDAALADISPLNLAGAIASQRPGTGTILSVATLDDAVRSKAMLAGVRAILRRDMVAAELPAALTRVSVSSQSSPAVVPVQAAPEAIGKVLVVAGAKGGAGRSTIAAAVAVSCARAGIDTGLLDFDLQFGDLGFMFDVNSRRTLIDLVRDLETGIADAKKYGESIATDLVLYCPSGQPEHSEIVAPRVSRMLSALRTAHGLVVVNSGAFWTLVHAELIDASDLCLMVLEPTGAAVKSTVQAVRLCEKLGIPKSRLAFVLNKVSAQDNVRLEDVVQALASNRVIQVSDGGVDVRAAADAGDFGRVLDRATPFADGINDVLRFVGDAVGLGLSPVASDKKPPGRWFARA
jgi:pilus assembly protein CpaE